MSLPKRFIKWLTFDRIITPYPDKPWIKMQEWDGRFFVDFNEYAKTQEFKDQCEALGRMVEKRRAKRG